MPHRLKPYYIAVDQLRVGTFIILDIKWLDHNFSRNSFKLKNAEQIAEIRQLGLKQIRIDPARSDNPPPPLQRTDQLPAATEVTTPLSEEEIQAAKIKRERIERINQLRASVVECEKKFLKTANALKNINANVFSRPQDAHRLANELIGKMLDSLMTDRDIAIHLMNDKAGSEEMYFHALNVAVLAMMLAKELGLPAEEIKELGVGCLFHDIGKLNIPDRVLQKSSGLTRAEQNLLQQHCQYGEEIVQKMGLSRQAVNIVMQHHECMDGSGYPKLLQGDQISPLARIAAIVNAYDNHCNRTNPSDSLSPYAALSYMFARQRPQFDTGPLGVFIRCLGVYPPGTLVRLSDGTLGMVMAVNASKPLRPSVLIYDPGVPKGEAIILDLEQEPDISISESLRSVQLPREVYDYLSPRKRMTYYFDVPQTNRRGPA
ncbi:MAG TPA: HD-GYP domain-containing protein [Paucimonas sp.]|nr:HD-GYP domain-containing protein [Paucimonas sp.]HJW54338.1 HD-GYP domain-containing protein [Burkholderiaceae bacterium]